MTLPRARKAISSDGDTARLGREAAKRIRRGLRLNAPPSTVHADRRRRMRETWQRTLAEEAELTESRLHLAHPGGAVSRTFAVVGWPAAAWWGFWQPLLRLRDGRGGRMRVRVSLLAAPFATSFWGDEQKYQVRRLRAEAEMHRRAGASWKANELEASASSLESLKNREVMDGAATFGASAVLTVTAPSVADLDADCASLTEWAEARGLRLDPLPFGQLPGFMAGHAAAAPVAPAGLPRRILDEDAFAALVPAQDGPWGGRGVYAGVRAHDGAFVTLPLDDPAAAEGTNIVILGTNGSGKSFYAKALLTGMLLSGFRVVVFDVDGEFRAWCEAWGGTWVDHTPGSGRYVEPMRIAPRPGGYEDMVRRVAAVVSLLAGGLDALGALGENVVDKVTTETCLAAGVDPQDPATWSRPLRLRDWYGALTGMAAWEVSGGRGGGDCSGAAGGSGGARPAPVSGGPASPEGGAAAARPTSALQRPPGGVVPATLEEATLRLVRQDPALGERALTRALADCGATPGRTHRILQRHALETEPKRRAWTAAAGDAAPDAARRPGAAARGAVGSGAATAPRSARRAGASTPPARPPAASLPPELLAAARDLAARLEPYFAGGLAYVFGAEDTVDFTAPLVVIHAADGADAEDRLGALKMSLDGAAVREMLESERQAARRYTAVYFDEGQRLLPHPQMRRYIADLFTAIRKRNGMAMLATNSTQALFEREGDVTKAGPIWQNARGKVLLAMSREAVEDVRGHGSIPGDVVALLEGLRPADHLALLEWDGRHELVRMDVSAEEAALYRTRGLRVAAPDAPSASG